MKTIISAIIVLFVVGCKENPIHPITDNPNSISVSNPQLITENGCYPKWSPNGTDIAFTSEIDGENRVLLWNPETNSIRRLISGYQGDVSINWNPDGTAIVFDAFQGEHNHQIWTYNITTGEYKQITHHNNQVFHPDWLKDNTNIIAMSGQSIYLIDINDGYIQKVSNSSINAWHPSANWNATQFVFTSDRDCNNNIYAANIDGTRVSQITTYEGYDDRARWSPDGTQIVFESDRDGKINIWLYSFLTQSYYRLTTDGGQMPDWSIDEENIAYMNNGNIYTIKLIRVY